MARSGAVPVSAGPPAAGRVGPAGSSAIVVLAEVTRTFGREPAVVHALRGVTLERAAR